MALLMVLLASLFLLTPILLRIKFKTNYWFWIFIFLYTFLFLLFPIIKYAPENFSSVALTPYSGILEYVNVKKTILFIVCFYILVVVGYLFAQNDKNNRLSSIPLIDRENKINRMVSFFSFCGLLGSIGWFYFSGMSINELFNASRFEYKETRNAIPQLISSYLRSLSYVSVFLISLTTSKSAKGLTIAAFIGVFLQLMVSGSRSPLIGIAGAYILGNYCFRKKTEKSTLNQKHLIFVGILSTHLVIVWQYVRYAKANFNGVGDWVNAIFFNVPDAYALSLGRGDLTYFFDAAVTSFQVVPSMHDFLYGDSYLRLLLLPFPHSLFPGLKPEETQRVFASIINYPSYLAGGSYPPSVIGDAYINLGWFGLLVGLVIGIVLKKTQGIMNSETLTPSKIAIGSTGMLFWFLLIRGTMNGLFVFAFVFIAVYIYLVVPKPKILRIPKFSWK